MSFLHGLENFSSPAIQAKYRATVTDGVDTTRFDNLLAADILDMHIDNYNSITALSTSLSCTFSQARAIIPYLDPFQPHPLSYYLNTYPEAFL